MSIGYPIYDFRYMISKPNLPQSDVISSFLREPLLEILRSWEYLNDVNMFNIFNEGIYHGIIKNRYNPIHLKLLLNYPEFYENSLKALLILWHNLPIYKNNDGKLIICKYPKDGYQIVELSQDEKNNLLYNANYESKICVKEISELIKNLTDKVNSQL